MGQVVARETVSERSLTMDTLYATISEASHRERESLASSLSALNCLILGHKA